MLYCSNTVKTLAQYSNNVMPVTTIRLSDDLNDQIEDALDYNDTKSDWFRQAAIEKLQRDGYNVDNEASAPN
jgi:predicted transcriptional regulator